MNEIELVNVRSLLHKLMCKFKQLVNHILKINWNANVGYDIYWRFYDFYFCFSLITFLGISSFPELNLLFLLNLIK